MELVDYLNILFTFFKINQTQFNLIKCRKMKRTILTISIAIILHCLANSQVQDDLFSSCLKCDLNGVKKAVESGTDVNAPHVTTKQNALAYSYLCPDITRYLLEKKCDPNGGSYPALVGASGVGSYEVMQILLDNGADFKTPLNQTALIQVVKMTNCAECVELLLSRGANKDVKESVYGNVIGTFASYGLPQRERKEAMKKYGDVLKGYGLAVPDWYYNPSVKLNATPDEMIKVLVKHGIDINKRGTNLTDTKLPGEPPLFTAMNVGKQEIILCLLNNGADYNATYLPIEKGITIWSVEGGYTPLMYACVKGYPEIVKWLTTKPDLLNQTVSGTTISESKMILKINGLSAIYLAIMGGNMEIVKAIADTPMKWEDIELNALPGQKFEGNYGSKDKAYNFIVSKKSSLKYTPSLFADFLKQSEMAEYLRSKGL